MREGIRYNNPPGLKIEEMGNLPWEKNNNAWLKLYSC